DFIIVGDLSGVVQHVGIKTTRVTSLSGEQIVFSNTDLLSSRVRNYRRMKERRVVFGLGVTYQTTSEKVEAIPGIIREIVEALEMTRFDRTHFKRFGDSSLDFEVVYYVKDRDYALYMDIQQQINLEIMKQFETAGIEFAYPTQTLFVQKESV
ncbi:MAG: mechanosensitive ion channel domain-containing protein, partial [bacterium]